MSTTLTPEMIGMQKISPSQLGCYEDCPKLFYYQQWLGLKLEDDKMHMDFGTALHYAMEVLYADYDWHFGNGWDAEKPDKMFAAFDEKWKQSSVTDLSFKKFKKSRKGQDSTINSKEELYNHMHEDGIKILESYWDMKDLLITDYGLDLTNFEMKRKLEFFNPDEPSQKLPIPVSYRIDAMTRKSDAIVDFKTSSSAYNVDESKKKLQGQIYLLGHFCETGELIKKFFYVVLRKELKTKDRVQVVSLVYDQADLSALFHRINNILWSIANREFERPLVGHAPYCQCKDYEQALNIN